MRTNVYVPEFDVRIKGKFVDPDIKQSIISINCDSNLDQAEMFQIVMENLLSTTFARVLLNSSFHILRVIKKLWKLILKMIYKLPFI